MLRLSVLVALFVLLVQSGLAQPFAGSAACAACHQDLSIAFAKSPHHVVDADTKRGWEGRACESCHGPALKHTESASAGDVQNPAKLTAVAADKICLSCHLNQPTHIGRLQSSHARDRVSCTACHKVHAGGAAGGLSGGLASKLSRKASAINEQCAGCHLSALAQFRQPFHHKVPEGAMSCVDCHNPHGSVRPAMTQSFAANEPGCLRCHGDKRGPFTFQHAPMRFEGCGSCHESHGSANPRMLVRAEVRLVCLECHANLPGARIGVVSNGASGAVPASFHDLRSARFQNCTVCHQKIHGSHVDRNLLR